MSQAFKLARRQGRPEARSRCTRLVILAAVAALWRFRPSLPNVSLSTPPTTTAVRQGLICVIWLLAAYILLALLTRAARIVIRGPAWQREVILPPHTATTAGHPCRFQSASSRRSR